MKNSNKSYRVKAIFFQVCCLALLLFNNGNLNAQDVHFSQFNLSPMNFNPGMTGVVNANLRASVTYRNQWPGVAPYITYSGAVDGSFKAGDNSNAKFTAGAHIYKDVAGDVQLGTFQMTGFFGSILQLNRNSDLSLGLSAGLLQRSLDYNNMIWDAQYVNGEYNPANNTYEFNNSFLVNKGNVGAGVVYRYQQASATLSSNDQRQLVTGLGVMHLNRPNISFMDVDDRLPMKFSAHADFLYGFTNTNYSIRPGFLFSRQGGYKELVLGTYWVVLMREPSKRTGFISAARVSFGTHVRVGDAFIPSVFLEVSEYKLGISYDTNFSGLTAATQGRGGIEITFIYTNPATFYYKRHQPGGSSPFL